MAIRLEANQDGEGVAVPFLAAQGKGAAFAKPPEPEEWFNRKAGQRVHGGVENYELIPGDGSVAEERRRRGDGRDEPVTEIDAARNGETEYDPEAGYDKSCERPKTNFAAHGDPFGIRKDHADEGSARSEAKLLPQSMPRTTPATSTR